MKRTSDPFNNLVKIPWFDILLVSHEPAPTGNRTYEDTKAEYSGAEQGDIMADQQHSTRGRRGAACAPPRYGKAAFSGDAAGAGSNRRYTGTAADAPDGEPSDSHDEEIKRLSRVVDDAGNAGDSRKLWRTQPPLRRTEQVILPKVNIYLIRNSFIKSGPGDPGVHVLLHDCLMSNDVLPLLKLWKKECLDQPANNKRMQEAFQMSPDGWFSVEQAALVTDHAYEHGVTEVDFESSGPHSHIMGVCARYVAKIYNRCSLINSVNWKGKDRSLDPWRGYHTTVGIMMLAYVDLRVNPGIGFFDILLDSSLSAPMQRKVRVKWEAKYSTTGTFCDRDEIDRCVASVGDAQEGATEAPEASGDSASAWRPSKMAKVDYDSLLPFTPREQLAVLKAYKTLKGAQKAARIDGEPTEEDWVDIAAVVPGRTAAECASFFEVTDAIISGNKLQLAEWRKNRKRPAQTLQPAETADDEDTIIVRKRTKHQDTQPQQPQFPRSQQIEDSSSDETPLMEDEENRHEHKRARIQRRQQLLVALNETPSPEPPPNSEPPLIEDRRERQTKAKTEQDVPAVAEGNKLPRRPSVQPIYRNTIELDPDLIGYGTIEGDDSHEDPIERNAQLKAEVVLFQNYHLSAVRDGDQINIDHINDKAHTVAALRAQQDSRDIVVVRAIISKCASKVQVAGANETRANNALIDAHEDLAKAQRTITTKKAEIKQLEERNENMGTVNALMHDEVRRKTAENEQLKKKLKELELKGML